MDKTNEYENLTFGDVLHIQQGYLHLAKKSTLKFARTGWNGKNQSIELQKPDEHSKMTKPYFFINTVDNGRVPWLASQTDLLAEDWYVVFDEKEGE